jgi:hypothetical protein
MSFYQSSIAVVLYCAMYVIFPAYANDFYLAYDAKNVPSNKNDDDGSMTMTCKIKFRATSESALSFWPLLLFRSKSQTAQNDNHVC